MVEVKEGKRGWGGRQLCSRFEGVLPPRFCVLHSTLVSPVTRCSALELPPSHPATPQRRRARALPHAERAAGDGEKVAGRARSACTIRQGLSNPSLLRQMLCLAVVLLCDVSEGAAGVKLSLGGAIVVGQFEHSFSSRRDALTPARLAQS